MLLCEHIMKLNGTMETNAYKKEADGSFNADSRDDQTSFHKNIPTKYRYQYRLYRGDIRGCRLCTAVVYQQVLA